MKTTQSKDTDQAQQSRWQIAMPSALVGVLAMALPFSAMADDPKFEISGQVNAALLFGGDIADPEVVDNTASGSRLRIRASRDVLGGQRGFLRYEFQAQENNSFGAVDGGESFDTRFAEVGIITGWGAVSLGKGEGASDGTAEISYQTSGNLFGGGHLPLFTVVGALNRDNADRGVRVGYTYYDGFGRVSRLRYDSPKFAGFRASASLNSGDRQEFALRYRNAVGPGRLLGNVGVANSADGDNDRLMLGVGYKLNSGFSVSFGHNERTQGALNGVERGDLESQLLSLNYELGKWIFSFDIGEQGGDVGGDNEVQQIGFQYNESKPLKMYAAYSKYDNADGSSLDAFFVGARYTFGYSPDLSSK
ncbi:MAG: porin [Burkholderiaceae bacterium]